MAGKQGDRRYTVMVVPHSQQPPVAFRLPMTVLKFLGTALVFVPLVLVGFFNSYHGVRAVMPELEELRLDNQLKSEQIERLAEETQRILGDLQRLRLLEQRLLEITDIDDASQGAEDALKDDGRNFRRDVASRSITTAERTLLSILSLQEDLPEQEKKLEDLKEAIEEQQRREAATPSIWPTWGIVSSPFGWRRHPINRSMSFHIGIDIAGRNIHGAGVYATGKGIVSYTGYQTGGYGYFIIIDHGYGYTTYYAHLSRIQVRTGQRVEKGALIGNVGNTGNSTGPHLHYEVRKYNTPQNPFDYLP